MPKIPGKPYLSLQIVVLCLLCYILSKQNFAKMKISKKIGTGFAFLLLALAAIFLSFHKYTLADVASGDISGATYTFQDRGNIIGDFGTSGSVTFTDPSPLDGTRNYVPSQGGFCDPGTIANQNGVAGNIKFGINISSGASLTSATIPAQVKLGYLVGNNCNGVLEKISITNPQTPVPVAAASFQWDGQNITTFPGQSNQLTFKQTSTSNGTDLYFSNQSAGSCPQNGAILLTNGSNQGLYYILSGLNTGPRGSGSASNLSSYKQLNDTGAVNSSECTVSSVSNITISGTQGQAATGGPNTVAQTGSDDSSCEATSGSSLAWVMCPLFNATSAIVKSTVGIFENLLSFTVAQDLGNAQCQINNQGCQASVKLTWSIIKNIASIILVVILLVMVFSQAIGGGPFDAYTIRKLLPKLVAAVIIMQLSWPLVAWIIDIFNDIGNGLQSLLFAPFGGTGALNDLGKLVKHALPGADPAEIAAFNWVAIIAAGAATIAALPTALFLAFAALVGLFVGIITLIFRKILIIMLLILSPLAIIAWVLPGTERYWKLWFDNLLKTLAMFPLIVALIAAGRIFAYVAGPQTSGSGGFAANMLALLFVLVGFIGPLFILPRTYKWGGSIMTAAGGAIASVGTRVNKGAEQPIKGFGERQQGKWAKRYNPEAGLASRVARRIQSGHVLPTKRSQRLAIAAGDKWQSERDEEALALINRKGEKAREGYKTIRRDEHGNMIDENGNITTDVNQATRELKGVAAMKQMWVDLAENGRDDHEKKMAIKKLIATSSWPEVQGSYTQSGKKVIDTDAWRNAVTTSEEDYPKVLRSRVDAAPHIIDSALQAGEEAGFARTDDSKAARDFRAAYRINYAIEKQMSNEDFATQSDGFWNEVNRMANQTDANGNLTRQAIEIKSSLRKRLKAIHDIGGTAPQQLLGHLATGGSLEADVNAALGEGANIRDYLDVRSDSAPPGDFTASGRNYDTGNVPGGQRTEGVTRNNIQNMSTNNVDSWVQSRGGYEKMSNQDLVVIYNVRRDQSQQAAAEELRRRGLMGSASLDLPGDVEPTAAPTTPPAGPAPGPSGTNTNSEGTLDIPRDTPDDDFRDGGRFPPPNIPPGPEGV